MIAFFSVAGKRRLSAQQLDDEDAHAPPVDVQIVTGRSLTYDLRRLQTEALNKRFKGEKVHAYHVLDGATKALGSAVVLQLLRQAEVGDDDVSVGVQQNVLQLDVAVNDLELKKIKVSSGLLQLPASPAYLVELLEREDDLGDVEANFDLREVLRLVQVGEQLATLVKVQHQVKLLRSLEGVLQGREERTVDDLLEHLKRSKSVKESARRVEGFFYLSLGPRVLRRLLLLRDFDLLQHLHGVQLARVNAVFLLHQINSSIGACAQQLEVCEVGRADFVLRVEFDWKYKMIIVSFFLAPSNSPFEVIFESFSISSTSSTMHTSLDSLSFRSVASESIRSCSPR